MIKKILQKRLNAHITVFAALLFIVVSVLIITIIFFSIYCATVVRIDYASALAQESAFAGFTNHIFNKYGIFVLNDTVSVYNRRKNVLLNNIKDSKVLLTDMYITDSVYMTDEGGKPFFDQAVEYMKSESLIDYANNAFADYFNDDFEKDLNKIAGLADQIRDIPDDTEEDTVASVREILEKFNEAKFHDESKAELARSVENDINNSFSEIKEGEAEYDEDKGNAFRKTKSILRADLTSLVLGNEFLSKEFIKQDWETNENITDKNLNVEEGINRLSSQLLFEEYLFLKFNSYTDGRNADTEEDGLLYGLEYIVGGKKSDRENLNEVMKRLSLIREGANIVFLMTDPESMAQIEMLAMAIFGFTLNPIIITIGKYTIMAAWAYAEAVADLKLLFNGKKVPIVKTKDTWNLSIENLLAGRISPDAGKGKRGLDYEEYLRMLIYPQHLSKQCARAMDLMEMEMINRGREDFLMRKCIFAQKMHAEFSLPYGGQQYERDYDYAYGKIVR